MSNAIYAACNNFNIGASDDNDSWGIWIFNGGTINYDADTRNAFNLTQGTGGSGSAIQSPYLVTPW